MQGNSQANLHQFDYNQEQWQLIQSLKRQNFNLNQELERKNFEIQELEYEKMILEQRSHSQQQKLIRRNSLSNKSSNNRANDKLFLSSIQILLNQGLRELNIMKKETGNEEGVLRKKHMDTIGKVLEKLREKFSSEPEMKGVALGGNWSKEFNEIFYNELNELQFQEKVQGFREHLEEA